jgi:WD40 repeat protein
MKKTSKRFALVLAAVFLAGQSITADDIVISPTVLAAMDKIGNIIDQLPPGSTGVFGPVYTTLGEQPALKIYNMLVKRHQEIHPGVTLYDGSKIMRILGLKPDGHYTDDQIKGFLSTLKGPEWWLAGRIDDDGKFYIDSFAIEGFEGFERKNNESDPGIPFEHDELFRIVTGHVIPPIPNYKLVQLNGEVYKTAYNYDGDIVAVTSVGGAVNIFNTYNRKMIQVIREAGPKAIPVYADNQLLLAEESGILRIIEGNKEAEIKIAESPLTAIDVSARGRCYIGMEGSITTFDTEKKTILYNFEQVKGKVKNLVLFFDDKTVAAQDDNGIGLWRTSDGKKITTLKDTANVSVFAVDKMGNIAVAKKDNKIYLFSQRTQTFSDAFKAPGQPGGDAEITTLSFSPNGAYVVSGNTAGLVCTWHTGFLLGMHTIENHLAAVSSSSYRTDGSQYVTGGADSQLFFYDNAPAEPNGSLRVVNNTDANASITINLKTPREGASIGPKATKTYQNIPVGSVEVSIHSPAGVIIDYSRKRSADITMSKNGYTITLLKEAAPAMDFDVSDRLIPRSLSAATDGKSLVIGTGASAPGKSESGRASITALNIDTGAMSSIGSPAEAHRKNINATAWTEKLFITGADDGVFLWSNNKLETVLDRERCDSISVSADGKYLTTSSTDYDTKLYDLPARTLIRKIPGQTAILHNGSVLYVVNEKELVRVSIEGARLPVFPVEKMVDENIVISAGINSIRKGSGNTILIFRKDDCIEVRNAGPGTPLALPGKIAAQNAKGELAIGQLSGGEIKIYDVETGLHVKTVFAHNAIITDLVFMEDNVLASANRDGVVQILNITTANEVGKFGVFEDRQRVYLKADRNYGDSLHVLKNGRRLEN